MHSLYCASSCTCMLVREKLINLMNCRCKGLRKPQHWRFSLCVNRAALYYQRAALLSCFQCSSHHLHELFFFYTHSRPGILVLINDADWELMVRVCVYVCTVPQSLLPLSVLMMCSFQVQCKLLFIQLMYVKVVLGCSFRKTCIGIKV